MLLRTAAVLVCLISSLASPAKAAAPATAGTPVTLKTKDGIELKASYFSAGRPGPGVVLLHMCNSDRTAWSGLATRLAQRGLHVLTLDYRGYGESGGARHLPLPVPERQRLETEFWPSDVDLAFDYLVSQPGVDRARIGAGGASCGVNQSLKLAGRHDEVKTVVLMAGGGGQEAQQVLERSPGMPVLYVAAADDQGAVEGGKWLVGFSSNPKNEIQAYPTGGHGTELFARYPELEPKVTEWFYRHLVTSPVKSARGAGPKPGPSSEQMKALAAPGGLAKALAEVRAGKTPLLPPEGIINFLGYGALEAGRTEDALGYFQLNVARFPKSANAYDSLGDGHVAAKQPEQADAAARKALELLKQDNQLPEQLREGIRTSAEAKLKRAPTR